MPKGNTKEKKNEGFTLIELIIVVAILAILVGILAPQYTKYVEKSRRSADMSNAKEIETTLRLALVTEDIFIPIPTGSSDFVGLWVMICRNKDSAPKYYRDNGGLYGVELIRMLSLMVKLTQGL